MGAFGYGAFENDDALDFVAELVESDGLELLESALNEALSADYLEMPEASSALVAAEVLAAKNMRPPGELPADVREWLANATFALSESLLVKAQKAVARVATDSELSEELGEVEEWQSSLSDLGERLDAA